MFVDGQPCLTKALYSNGESVNGSSGCDKI